MKAMILCAGYGTRLGDLTRNTPKPLLRAGGKPLVDHIVANLQRHRFSDIMVNVHHHADQIQSSLTHWNAQGVSLNFSFEQTLLGTAGAVKKVEPYFSGESAFLVHYGDVVTDVDLSGMLDFHRERGATATILVHSRGKSNSALSFDQNHRVQNFVERPPDSLWQNIQSTWVNSGVLILSP